MPKRVKGAPGKSRNPELAPGIPSYGRSAMYRRSGKAAMAKAGKKFATQEKKPIAKKTRPTRRYYPTETVHRPIRAKKAAPTRLRPSITPGTVLILLAGRFRGKRVVFLKQLDSGLLLITGPFKINGVPLRRVNQAYVIATSTKVNISGLDLSSFRDGQFRKSRKSRAEEIKERQGFSEVAPKPQETEEEKAARKAARKQARETAKQAAKDGKKVEKAARKPFKRPEESEEKKTIRTNQQNFDKQLLALISQTPLLEEYLSVRFTLTRGQYPHEMKF